MRRAGCDRGMRSPLRRLVASLLFGAGEQVFACFGRRLTCAGRAAAPSRLA